MKIISVGTKSIFDGSKYPLVIFFEITDDVYYNIVNGYEEFKNEDDVYDFLWNSASNYWNTSLLSNKLMIDGIFVERTNDVTLKFNFVD
jgi:hypothetical protein